MSEENSVTSQVEEYEDDFEKDLDWLINEETKSSDEEPEVYEESEDIDAKINKELDDEEKKEEKNSIDEEQSASSVEKPCELNKDLINHAEVTRGEENVIVNNPDPISDSDSEGSFHKLKHEDQQEGEEQTEEVKRYIMEKIEQANKKLQDEDPIDQNRERRLKFKDNLVDLEVPPMHLPETEKNNGEVTGQMSEMCISSDAQKANVNTGNKGDEDKIKDKKVLMEKDGKFELVSLQDFGNQGLLPQIAVAFSENECKQSHCFNSDNPKGNNLTSSLSPNEIFHIPKPPDEPKDRATSAANIQKNGAQKILPRRVQSAIMSPKPSTHLNTSEQKEFNWRTQKKDQLKTEIGAKKTEEEMRKKEENKMAFGIWLQRKKQQRQEERRIQYAKELERKNNKEHRDPNEAFNLWLKKKREQQIKEQQIEAMRKREQDYNSKVHTREDSEKAFKQWLKRKKAEKRAEQLAAKERCRKFLMEARRVKRMQTLLCTLSESKSFQFDNYGYRF
ncbi:coiled-coil domain-containing protein 181 [Rhincodon typus]|uniref:coiled-coil domain-containing protein 181 n=1 Tax=Rhincodon typus TaxID=259920 RepID=UPI0009A46689|nr:coiled-coil domain-containing protein 181 [Rhincodon typus]XP_048459339.1 coiled-coil domain-containing protein 181 [Rhincodon typus]